MAVEEEDLKFTFHPSAKFCLECEAQSGRYVFPSIIFPFSGTASGGHRWVIKKQTPIFWNYGPNGPNRVESISTHVEVCSSEVRP